MAGALLVAASIVTGPTAVGSAAVTPSGWFQDGWNQSRSGYNPQELQLTATNAHALHQVWSRKTPEPCCDAPQTSSAVSADGTAYFAGASGDVRAVDVATGTLTWRRQAPECVSASAGPALHQDMLLVPTHACTPDDFNSWLTAYDARTGQLLWSHRAVDRMSSPLVLGGLAFVESSSAVNLGRTRLDAIDLSTGASRWHQLVGAQSPALAADGANLYLSTSATLTALAPATGTVRWTRSAAGGQVLTSAGHVVVAGIAGGSQVVSSYAGSGSRQWRVSLTGSSRPVISATPAEVVVADEDGVVEALHLADGTFSWLSLFSTAVTTKPAIAGGVVYLTLATPTSSAVYAVRDGTGAILWHYDEPAGDAEATASPSVADGTLFVSLGSGTLRAFRA